MTSSAPERIVERALRPFQRFARTEAAGGIVLLACTALALLWANSPWAVSYVALWEQPITIGLAPLALTLSVHAWINDGLMAVFFFLVGLEIKREMLCGELASVKRAALPIAGALGGMVIPATIYALLNVGGAGARGWGIPMATDIAFALGILALLGPRVPVALKVFLAALAIVDDIGAVLVIALFYTSAISWTSLAIAAGVLTALLCLNRARVGHPAPYALLGLVLWVAFLKSGVHPTIAGVLLAMTIPARTRIAEGELSRRASEESIPEETQALLQRLERSLHGVVAFLIVPLFALANAGVPVGRSLANGLSTPVVLGVVLGLVLGKPIGIMIASSVAVRFGVASLPEKVSWRQVYGASWLAGIGFTMSLFIAALAFSDAALLDSAKIGVLTASCCSGAVGWSMLRRSAVAVPRAAEVAKDD
jgi:Na+:H+ antiporter, NhaA family